MKNDIPNVSTEATTAFESIQKNISEGFATDNYEKFIKQKKLTDKSLINFLKDTNYVTKDLTNYQEYLKKAGEGMSTFSSITQKAGSTLKSFGAALGSMAVMWAVGKVISLVATGIDNLVNSAEHCKERVDNLMSSYNSAISSANSNAKAVENLADRYEELSKGVNSLGENVSLTTDEYSEYNNIVNQIATMFPTLIQGYTDEGTAILSLKGNVEELRNAYKDAQQEAYNMLITSGEDSDGNDIIENWNNLNSTKWYDKAFDGLLNHYDIGKSVSVSDAIEQLEAISNMSYDEFRSLMSSSIGTKTQQDEFEKRSQIEQDIYGNKSNAVKQAIGLSIDHTENLFLSEEEFTEAKQEARILAQTYQAEIENALNNVNTLANAYLMTNDDYNLLEENSKSLASLLVNSIDENAANGFNKKGDVGKYVSNIIESIGTHPELEETLNGLFTTDFSDMSVKDANAKINEYINTIAETLDKNTLELKVALGFDNYNNYDDYQKIFDHAAYKASGASLEDISNNLGDYSKYNEFKEKTDYTQELKEKIDDFASEYSINTQEEVDAFQEALKKSNYDIDKAFTYYLESQSIKASTSSAASFSTAQEALNTALSEQASTGTISSETLAKLQQNYEGIENALEITTNGIILNTQKLSELTSAERENIETDLENKEKELTQQFNQSSIELEAYKSILENTTSTDEEYLQSLQNLISEKENDKNATRLQLDELKALQLEYENVTSKHNRFIQSLSSADEGSMYDDIVSGLEQVQNEWDAGNIGKDEIRNFVDYMSYDDMSAASIEEITSAYEEAMQKAQMYFTEGSEGSQRFLELLEQTEVAGRKLAEQDNEGNWNINIDDLNEAAQELGVSTEFLQDNLNKLKDKGFTIEFESSNEDLQDVSLILETLDERIETLKDRLHNGDMTEGLREELESLENQKIELEAQMDTSEIENAINTILFIQERLILHKLQWNRPNSK